MDPSKKSEKLRDELSYLSENIFSKIKNRFSGKSKDDPQDAEEQVDSVVKFDGNNWSINGNEIGDLKSGRGSDATYELMMNYDWENGQLSWLTNATFRAHLLEIDFNTETVGTFVGIWMDGTFLGKKFSEVGVGPGKSVFAGGKFGSIEGGGLLVITNEYWKTSPTDFVEGTIIDTEDGLLGLPNKTSHQSDLHLIQAPEGNVIKVTTEDDMSYEIVVNKRLNKINSLFSYNLLHSGEKKVIPWRDIRKNYNSFYIEEGSALDLPGLIKTGKLIKSIKITPGAASSPVREPEVKVYKFPFGTLPPTLRKGVDMADNIKLKISLKNADDINFFKRATSDFSSNGIEFEDNMDKIKKAIEIGLIDGYSKYPHLSMLWGRTNKGKDLDSEKNPTYDKAMSYMDSFIQHFIMNLHKDAQDRLLSAMRDDLMIMTPDKIKTVEKKPEAPTVDQKKVDKKKVDKFMKTLKKPTNEEIVRKEIREFLRSQPDETFSGKSSL